MSLFAEIPFMFTSFCFSHLLFRYTLWLPIQFIVIKVNRCLLAVAACIGNIYYSTF